MRIKFEKGMTPEDIGFMFAQIAQEKEWVIGSVNVYVQLYDEQMRAIKSSSDDDYLLVKPGDATRKIYDEEVAQIRRKRLKAI